jgi:hypothetical protein
MEPRKCKNSTDKKMLKMNILISLIRKVPKMFTGIKAWLPLRMPRRQMRVEIATVIRTVNNRWRCVVSFTLQLLYPGESTQAINKIRTLG